MIFLGMILVAFAAGCVLAASCNEMVCTEPQRCFLPCAGFGGMPGGAGGGGYSFDQEAAQKIFEQLFGGGLGGGLGGMGGGMGGGGGPRVRMFRGGNGGGGLGGLGAHCELDLTTSALFPLCQAEPQSSARARRRHVWRRHGRGRRRLWRLWRVRCLRH